MANFKIEQRITGPIFSMHSAHTKTQPQRLDFLLLDELNCWYIIVWRYSHTSAPAQRPLLVRVAAMMLRQAIAVLPHWERVHFTNLH